MPSTIDLRTLSHLIKQIPSAWSSHLARILTRQLTIVNDFDVKPSCRVATTGPIALSGEQTIDGIAVLVGDRILVKDQIDLTTNGIYDVAAGAWTRSPDANASENLTAGVFTFVEEGTVNSDSGWILSSDGLIDVGVDPVVWVQFTGTGQIDAGAGLIKIGHTLAVLTGDGLAIVGDAVVVDSTVVRTIALDQLIDGEKTFLLPLGIADAVLGTQASSRQQMEAHVAGVTVVHRTGAEVIADVKMFTSSPIIPDGTLGDEAVNRSQLDTKSDDSLVVHLSGPETIADVKTFTSSPIVPAPTADGHAVNRSFVQALIQGLDVKASCRLATISDVPLSGLASMDGVAPVSGDRVLVKDQVIASQNGIYIAAAGPWYRAVDAFTSAEVSSGMFTFIEEGVVNADNGWVLVTDNVVLGTTPLVFQQFSGAGQITAGDGLIKSGNELSVNVGSGIVIIGDAVSVADDVVRTFGLQDIAGEKTFTDRMRVQKDFDSNDSLLTISNPNAGVDAGALLSLQSDVAAAMFCAFSSNYSEPQAAGNVILGSLGSKLIVYGKTGTDFYTGDGPPFDTRMSIADDFITAFNPIQLPADPALPNEASNKGYVDGLTYLDPGDGIDLTAPTISVDATVVRVDRAIYAGDGLLGGGDLTGDVTIDVNPGDGIQIDTDTVAVDATVVRTSGAQSIAGEKTFTDRMVVDVNDNSYVVIHKIQNLNTGNQALGVYSVHSDVASGLFGAFSSNFIESELAGNVGIGSDFSKLMVHGHTGIDFYTDTLVGTNIRMSMSNTEMISINPVSIDEDGSVPDPSAVLALTSIYRGFLMPRMTTAQRNLILDPAEGLMVYDTNFKTPFYFDGTDWVQL